MIEIFLFLLCCLPLFYTFVFAIYDSAQTARKDYPGRSIFFRFIRIENNVPLNSSDWEYLSKTYSNKLLRENVKSRIEPVFTAYHLWFIGGNEYYPDPGNFITNESDYWHRCKMMWVFMITFIASSAAIAGGALIAYFLIYGFSLFWSVLTGLFIIELICLFWIEGGLFKLFYNFKFDTKYNPDPNRLIRFIAWLTTDSKYPIYTETRERKGL